jgi:hypothetical protein
MLTCKSPRKVMLVAFRLARDALPEYTSKFSRHDFNLPGLFACLVAKELLKRSYREAEAVLRDCPQWYKDVGLRRPPDHNTLWRAAKFLLKKCRVERLVDAVARWAALARALGLSVGPLAVDATYYESRHVSRHYERRCHETRRRMRMKSGTKPGTGRGRKGERRRGRRTGKGRGIRAGRAEAAVTRADTIRRLPKLALGVCSYSHLAVSLWTGTGGGGDHAHFEPVLFDAWRRVPHRTFKVAADAGYDSEANHRTARHDMGLPTLIPPEIGRPPKGGGPPGGRWRRHMKRVLRTKAGRKSSGYTQRWQAETVNSMMKRNLSSALRGKTAWSRGRDLRLKTLTHDAMILANL